MLKAKPRHRHSQTCKCAQNKTRLFRQYARIFEQFEDICLQVVENFAGFTTQTKLHIIKETQACLIRANRIVGWETLPTEEAEQLPYRLMVLLRVEVDVVKEEFYDLPEVEKQIIFLNVHRQSKQIKEVIKATLSS